MEQVNNNSSPNFTISTNQLYYTHETDSLKTVIKNTSLKTTSYQVILEDQEHFKIMSLNRAFSLAPGISKQVMIKHICDQFCKIQARQILQAKVRDYNGNSIGFQCRCSNFVIKKKQVYIQYPKTIELGQFDQKINFNFQIKNISNKNLKIVFQDQLQTKSQNESTVLIQNTDKKLLIKNLTRDCILLTKTTLKFQFQLSMSEHGQLKQNIQFTIIAQEPSNKYIKRKTQQKQQNQNKFDVYCIELTGFSVSKKLIIKDQSQQIISQIRNQLLVGTSKSSYFYIQTQYHQDIPYTLQAYFQASAPDQYADKWKYLSIQLNDANQKIIKDQLKLGNMCQGVLKRQSLNKIQYKITARYTANDQNYVSKYSKIQFEDDSNALRMRNSQYARKYQSMQIKIVAKIQTPNIPPYTNKTLKNLRTTQNNLQISIPLKFTLVNPSLRVKVTQLQQQSTCVTILNQTKINILYSFPIHSLYRISNSSLNTEAQSLQSIFVANKKQLVTIKWTKNNQRCPVYMEIPSFDLVLYQIKNNEIKGKNIIVMPASRRRPMTSISSNINAKSRQNQTPSLKNSQNILNYGLLAQKSQTPLKISTRPTSSIKRYQTPETIMPLTYNNLTKPQQNILWKSLSKKVTITKQKPNILQNKRYHQIIPTIDELSYLVQSNKMIKNTHYSRDFLLQIFDMGYLLLEPGQFYVFDSSIKFKCSKNTNQWGFNSMPSIKYRIYGHTPVYSIQFSDSQMQQPIIPTKHQPITPTQKTVLKSQILPSRIRQTSNMFQLPTYQIISRQIKMSFKQSKQQFQIIQPILIKNCSSTQQLQINCVSIDGQFFKCKQPNGILIIKPDQIGQFKIGFLPQNTIKLSMLNHEAPQQIRRRAMVKSQSPISTPQSNRKIQKQIKLLINKSIQQITCIGEIVQKNCSIKPYKINLTNCRYGSPQIVETMIITNTSPYKINYIIQYPSQITIKPKSGVILPKATQNCSIIFKPCNKISNLQTNVKVFIGGSHLQLVPLYINVQDPQIYIKQTQLIPIQNAICGTQIQQLNLQMTIINNNPSQSFIQINLKDTPLYLGYTKNYHSINSKIVLQNFLRCSQIIQQNTKNKKQHNYPTIKNYNNSVTSIASQQNLLPIDNNILNMSDNCMMPQMCTITVAANSFLIIPLTLRIKNVKIGQNTLKLTKNIANLLGYGEIKSPHLIKYNCNKTLLHISPYKQLHQIILTQGQTNYQINLHNMAQKQIKVKTKITNIQQKQKQMIVTNQNIGNQQNFQGQQNIANNINSPHVVCTYKDIDEYLKPQSTINLNMSFICFQVNKKSSKTSYQLTLYVKQYNTNNDDSSLQMNRKSIGSSNNQQQHDGYIQYFTTIINVIVPQPFLSITPNILVLPTVGVNTWSRQSFYIVNNGFKEIYIKIKKPVNITFDFQCQIIPHQLPSISHTNRSNTSKQKLKQKESFYKQNKLPRQNSLSSISNTSVSAQQHHPSRQQPRILQNQLTKINNTIQIRVSFKSKTTISFKCILQIQDNFNRKYQLAIAGTCTDSPFFINQGNPIHTIRQFVSSLSFNSYNSQEQFVSSKHMTKDNKHNKNFIRRNNLQPTDIQDLLFLNNWIGSLLPQLSNQSTFFYIWLSKTNNFFKFLREFNVNLTSSTQKKIQTQQKQKQRGKQKLKLKDKLKQKFIQKDNEFSQSIQYHKMSLSSILQIMKKKGFQLNSIRVDLLQKADQMQWLTFMWFFFSKAIISPNFLSWFGKSIGCRQINQITYNYIQKNYQQLLTILLTTKFQLKKQNNDNKAIDWKYLIQNFQPLLQNFKHIESRRHLILSMNILYHKFSNIQNQILEISDFQFVMNITNQHNRKVRYFIQCDTKILICQQSSNKIMPSQTNHGYSLIVQENQHVCLTFSLRNYPINALAVITKCAIDLMNIIMWNNVIWDPITIFKIRLKRKDDIVHHVNIQCQIKASQQWFYKFQAKMSAEYRIFFQLQEGSDVIRLLSNQPGFLKKGQNTTLRVLYSPENMSKCKATLRIANTMVKQVFKIQGKPMHSSKIQYQKTLKIIQNQDYQQQIILPWQLPLKLPNKPSSAAKIIASISSRQQNQTNLSKNPQNQQQYFTIKLINPNSQSSQSLKKFQQCILKKILTYNIIKKQLCLTLNFHYKKLIRNLELIFQVSHPQTNESKLIRLIIDIIPKPIYIAVDIQCQFNSSITQTIKIQNLANMGENVSIKYGYLRSINKQNIDRQMKRLLADTNSTDSLVLANTYKGLFQLPKTKNNQLLGFSTPKSQKFLQYINLNIKYNPNQNNCINSQQKRIQQPKNSNSSRSNKMKTSNSVPKKKNQLNTSNNNSTNSNIDISQLQSNKNQLPYFYLTVNYQQSLYQITYIFKPSIKTTYSKIQCLVTQQKKDIYHQCLPLVKYIDNIICIQNNNDYPVQYTIQTDLYQILGNNQLTVNAMSVGKFYYQIYGMHLGKKQGKIQFKQIGSNRKVVNQVIQFNVTIFITKTPNIIHQPHPATPKSPGKNSSPPQQGIRLYNEKFQISSKIRKPKVFCIKLANLSQKQIQYQIRCNSQYLNPLKTYKINHNKYIKIQKKSQYELEIEYLPYFVGRKQANLYLYNAYQPDITYNIIMNSEEVIENIVKQMSKIGQNKPIELRVDNPYGNNRKYQQQMQGQLQVQLQLISATLNNKKIGSVQYYKYFKFFQQNTQQSSQQLSKNNTELYPTKLKLKYKLNNINPTSNQPVTPTNSYHTQTTTKNNISYKKLYVVFMTNQFIDKYQYQFVFNTAKFGQYIFRVCYCYPAVQRMPNQVLYTTSTIYKQNISNNKYCRQYIDNMPNIKKQQNNNITIAIPFINRFNHNLQLSLKTNPQLPIKILLSSSSSTSYQQNNKILTKQVSTCNPKLLINSYNKQMITLCIDSNNNNVSQLQIQVRSVVRDQFVWIYPITMYRVYQISERQPLIITGQARLPILTKMYPLVAYNCSKIQLFTQKQHKQSQHIQKQNQIKIQIKLKQDILRKRKINKQFCKNNTIENQDNYQLSQQVVENSNKYKGDSLIPKHIYLNSQYLYEVQLEINTASAMNIAGYFYVYQNGNRISSKNISPAVSEKDILSRKQSILNYCSADNLGYFVQKIPFILKIQVPRIQTIEFEADVGQKSTVRIMLDSLNSENPKQNGFLRKMMQSPKTFDVSQKNSKIQVKIQLHNNKNRQFSAFYNEKQQCIEVTYQALQYSGLKKGKLQIYTSGIYSQYELIGKFPKKYLKTKRSNKLFVLPNQP